MSGICNYIPTQTLSNWCTEIDLTGNRVAIGLSLVVIIALARLQNAAQTQQPASLQGRVQAEAATRLSEFLTHTFGNPETKAINAESFIGSALPQDRKLWEFLIRVTLSTLISDGRYEYLELLEKVDQGPGFLKFDADINEEFLKETEKLIRYLSGDESIVYAADMVQELEDLLAQPLPTVAAKPKLDDDDKGKQEL